MPGSVQSRHAFESGYSAGLDDHLAGPTEQSLHTAYELGRDAVTRELSVLEVAAIHQGALLDALGRVSDTSASEVASAAGDFFLEALSAFEMVQRGVREAREAASAERRSATMLRHLSSLLADPSLALDEADAPAEALRLVAEEARELTRAGWAVATAVLEPGRLLAETAGPPEGLDRDPAPTTMPDLARRHELVREAAGAVRLTAQELAGHPSFGAIRRAAGRAAVSGWMAAPLRFLDGSDFGCLEVFDSERGAFADLDEAVLVHLAQMTSGALERARLYRPSR